MQVQVLEVPMLSETLDSLAAFEPVPLPVLSLYLNTTPGEQGRPTHAQFLRKEFSERLKGYALTDEARASVEADLVRVPQYIDQQLEPQTRGVALFACAGVGLFEPIQLQAPFAEHQLVVSDRPHLYPLARLDDQFPRYAAVVVDTNHARVFVFSTGRRTDTVEVLNEKTKQVKVGGWSQARYQRHVENMHLHHLKEVADVLDRIVRSEGIQHVVIFGDEALVPLLREQLPEAVDEKIVDVRRLDRAVADQEIVATTLDAIRAKDVEGDQAIVEELLGEYRRSGLAVAGVTATRAALLRGQVDRLVISASPAAIDGGTRPSGEAVEHTGSAAIGLEVVEGAAAAATRAQSQTDAPTSAVVGTEQRLADELVRLARRTDADVRFIEDSTQLEPIGGVGAFLRFKIQPAEPPVGA
jgi:peptide chain release factor subunit 1